MLFYPQFVCIRHIPNTAITNMVVAWLIEISSSTPNITGNGFNVSVRKPMLSAVYVMSPISGFVWLWVLWV